MSRLASLFGGSQNDGNESNDALKYSAPKEPKPARVATRDKEYE